MKEQLTNFKTMGR